MSNIAIGKTMLRIAFFLGFVQGLLTLIGGCVASHDSNRSVNISMFYS